MNVIDKVRSERAELARVLKNYSGIRRIVEDLYPDSAHFIYELLQNAEDAGATEAHFTLGSTKLVFEHNGRPFDERDVHGITSIGDGSKGDDEDTIGRFGVGFKAVFAYSETPHIWSPTFSFKITELVLPSRINPAGDLGKNTRFKFPFDNPKKDPEVAFREVRDGLNGLAETTLLFLPNLRSVTWRVAAGELCQIARTHEADGHVEIQKQREGKPVGSAHFLKFDRPVTGLRKQRTAVAFELAFLPGVTKFDTRKKLDKQMKVVPASPGRVSVFFPAEKETSGLRFHLHAPFVPELSRASIKETPANVPLFEQLAVLTAFALYKIRDSGLLTTDFYEVLPNAQDAIEDRYDLIRSAIHEEMKNNPLTPTHAKTHGPASRLLRGKAGMKDLIPDEDLGFLIDHDGTPPQWSAGVAQKNSNADRFLEGLVQEEWGVEDFVAVLCNKTGPDGDRGLPESITPEEVTEWLTDKSLEWHQKMYAFLQTDYLSLAGPRREALINRLRPLRIVRLADGTYGSGEESFFESGAFPQSVVAKRVESRVFTSGKSKVEKENARRFLEEIGVRDIGEAELVEIILKERYTEDSGDPDEATHQSDLARFIQLVETQPESASLFWDYYIFQCDDDWGTSAYVFLDKPFTESGLSAYYLSLGEDEKERRPLHEKYLRYDISLERLCRFALAVGAVDTLVIEEVCCSGNPKWPVMAQAALGNWSRYGVNRDYTIPHLDVLLSTPNAELSRLIWNTLSRQEKPFWTTAAYRNNASCEPQQAPSQLACILSEKEWVPRIDGGFVRPADAYRESLPSGFPFDPGWEWLKAIRFGENSPIRTEDQINRRAAAEILGFTDPEALDRALRFVSLPPEEQQKFLSDRESAQLFELPEHEPANPSRRAQIVSGEAERAPERLTVVRPRSVPVDLDQVKKEAGEYLRQQYTNPDGVMICQICKKGLPFKLSDGTDYFERVELLRTLRRRHKQNYLALCPNHAAMFQHANDSPDTLPEQVGGTTGNELEVVLARETMTVRFTRTHLADLAAILRAERGDPDTGDPEPPDVSFEDRSGLPAR